ncbi:MAG: hypothetical protein U0T07_03755 [Chitinophagales bacterium]
MKRTANYNVASKKVTYRYGGIHSIESERNAKNTNHSTDSAKQKLSDQEGIKKASRFLTKVIYS